MHGRISQALDPVTRSVQTLRWGRSGVLMLATLEYKLTDLVKDHSLPDLLHPWSWMRRDIS